MQIWNKINHQFEAISFISKCYYMIKRNNDLKAWTSLFNHRITKKLTWKGNNKLIAQVIMLLKWYFHTWYLLIKKLFISLTLCNCSHIKIICLANQGFEAKSKTKSFKANFKANFKAKHLANQKQIFKADSKSKSFSKVNWAKKKNVWVSS